MQRSVIPPRRSATQSQLPARQQPTETEDYPEPPRMPSSARRYSYDTSGNQVITQGNKRLVIHNAPPPRKRSIWLPLCLGMLLMALLYPGGSWALNWWSLHQLDAQYGFPRTYQTDAIVYPGDNSDHPSHYIFLNLKGTIEIIEFPHGDSAHARIYKGATLISNNAALIPVTGEFKEVGGKEEMLVYIQNQVIVYVSDGTQFKLQ